MFYKATKLVIVIEHFISDRVCAIIESCNGKGYTLIRAGGKGLHRLHSTSDKATVVEGFDNIKIEAIIYDRKIAETIGEKVVTECFKDYPGVMYLQEIEVCRPDRF